MTLYHYTNLNSFLKIWRYKHLLFSTSHKRTNNDIFEKQKYITIAGDALSVNRKHLESFWASIDNYKQISLTMDYDSFIQGCMSPMMWGQYADKAKGVCIEFDYNKLMQHIEPKMLHNVVSYVSILPEPLKITQAEVMDFDSFFMKNRKDIFFTKHNSWSHENEYRIVSKKEFLKIDDAITAIYITKCGSYECECIEKLLKDNNEIFFLCVYQDFMPNVGTYYNICDVEQRKKSYCHDESRKML